MGNLKLVLYAQDKELGAVVGWDHSVSEDGTSGFALSGYMDPIAALQTIEGQEDTDGFVWVTTAQDPTTLDGVCAVRARDVVYGRVSTSSPPPTPASPAPGMVGSDAPAPVASSPLAPQEPAQEPTAPHPSGLSL